MSKQEILKKFINQEKLDYLLITSSCTRFWLTESTMSAGTILASDRENKLFVDSRYAQACDNPGFMKNINKFTIVTRGLHGNIDEIIKEIKPNSIIGFESEYLSYNDYLLIKNKFDNFTLKPVKIKNIRKIKTEEEIFNTQKACNIINEAYDYITKNLSIGMSEVDIKSKLDSYLIAQHKITDFSFGTLVAIDENSAQPHHWATDTKKLKNGSMLLIDFGVKYKGYCSDMTRTCFYGNPSDKLKEMYNVVLEAQKLGVENAKAGMKISDLDKIVRDSIAKNGYGKYFIHGLGHSMGIENHEEPYINGNNDDILREGNIITIEPGVYIKNIGGIRIEDDVVIRKDACELLTKTPKNLKIISKRN